MSRIVLEVTPEQHKQIKVMASLEGKSIKELILESVFNEKKTFKSSTLKAIDDVNQNKNLNTYNSAKELFNKFR
ncbi:MAG: hypothetical protein J0G32_04605 [Alphaproteobacteria bacterium]|jgi:uncharacterized protein (DUF1778 family)|nr:hypothetical protein [Alphaproteobacteria bacterium]OJV12569.1 MAG: hypothetical protein BGO27_03500 [Alphaproteobacteria bacterium 33-17]